MSAPVFLTDFGDGLPAVGAAFTLTGPEAHHAVTVRRIAVGEFVVLSDGEGHAVAGEVVAVDRKALTLRVDEHRHSAPGPLRWVVVQALAKGDRGELAVEVLTEQGVDEIVPWEARRSMLRWKGERGAKGLARWRSTAREATKQSRRLRIPYVSDPCTTKDLVERVRSSALAMVLHEDADAAIAGRDWPDSGEVLLIVGPEGGIDPEELSELTAAGAHLVLVSDGVLRTSTAGLVGLAQCQLAAAAPVRGNR